MIWKSSKNSKENFRLLAYIIPYIIPIITLTLNGILFGTTLSFFIFNGILSACKLAGIQGILTEFIFSVSCFLAYMLPHRIIELQMIIIAAAHGYRFARVYSHKILNNIAAEYIRSSYLWTMVSMMLILLLLAAYIETNITPTVARQAADLLSYLLF